MKRKSTYSRQLLKQYRNMQKQEREGVVFSEQKAEEFISELRQLVCEHSADSSDYKLLEAC